MKKHLPILLGVALGAVLFTAAPTIAQIRAMYFGSVVINDTTANALVVGGAPGATSGTGGVKGGAFVGATLNTTGVIASSAGNVSDSVGTLDAVRDGGWTVASQGVGDVWYATTSSQAGRVNGTGILQMNGASAPTVVSPGTVGGVILLCESDGTNTTASATNVATCAISGLTIKDTLEVHVRHSSVTQTTAEPLLYNSTDSVNLLTNLNGAAAIAANTYGGAVVTLGCDPATNTIIYSQGDVTVAAGSGTITSVIPNYNQIAAATTAWTGSWTMALRTGAGGVTAGGTYRYRIAVYKRAGQ